VSGIERCHMTINTANVAGNSSLLPARDEPYLLREVYELLEDTCRTEVVLQMEDSYLLVRVDEDTDALDYEFSSGEFFPGPNHQPASWKNQLGSECDWTWTAVNQQGYMDSILLSFDGVVPTVLLHGIATSIEVLSIVPIR